MVKVISFDIDTTLTYDNSWYALTKELGASVNSHRLIFEEFIKNHLTYKEAKDKLLYLWQETDRTHKQNFAKIFQKIKLKKDAQPIVKYLKQKGFIICLITGSMDLYAAIMAERLGVTHYFANTELVWNKDDKLVDFRYVREQGAKKVQQLQSLCDAQKVALSDCYVVGDDENDLELFRATQRGIAVKSPSSHKLERYAWKVVAELSELSTIL